MSSIDAAAVVERMLIATRSDTLRNLALALGLKNHSPISTAKRKGVFPKKWFLTLRLNFGANPDWIRTGEGDMAITGNGARIVTREAEMLTSKPLAGIIESADGSHVRYPTEYVAPQMLCPWLDEDGKTMKGRNAEPVPAIPKTWLSAAGVASDNMSALGMPSRDMEPEIHEGDIVMLDHKNTKPVHGQIYCIAVGGSLMVRRFAGDRNEFAGDNQNVRPIAARDTQIVGKVVLWVRR